MEPHQTLKSPDSGATEKQLLRLGFTVDLCSSDGQNFKKLIAHRFHILPALELSAAYHMKKQGKRFSDLERLLKLENRYDYYLALNVGTPAHIIKALQSALDEMKKDGTYDRIKQQYE